MGNIARRTSFATSYVSRWENSRLGGYRGLRYLVRQLRRHTGLEQEQRLPPNIASVLFVCHANLIRSPAAAQFLRDELRNSANSQIAVASAGTNARNDCAADRRDQRLGRVESSRDSRSQYSVGC